MKRILVSLLIGLALVSPFILNAAESPKKLLVVTTTEGYRHSSIPLAEKAIARLGEQSGAFTVDFVEQPDGKPTPPATLKPLPADATPDDKTAYKAVEEALKGIRAEYETANAAWQEKMKTALSKLSPESLKNYDGVVFVSTTGELPIPDKEGFLSWIKSGKAFIGIHAASDTFHQWPAFIDMLGGEFQTHPSGTYDVEAINQDPKSPACSHLGASLKINDEIYLFKNFDGAKVHRLLSLDKHPKDKTPGDFPVAWTKEYGKGRIFYTSLGHREDLWDLNPDLKDRKNPVETEKAFQDHVLGGIKWSLGIAQ
jgi:type 1 glutamine amidotransferase